ncbi:MAG: glutamate--tRNA ligase [Gammaproteobacteria bacterium]|nr:glutamate--tRNA ligase [Gammaproteobacteria bacterium]
MTMTMKTRFAPSPTGLLHIGNVRTALFNALLARGHQGTFLLRIEDTDQERSRDEYTEALKFDLHWLQMGWQEGPDVGGEHAPYAQSQCDEIYRHYFDELEKRDLAYPCFCSQRELDLSRKTQLSAGRPPRYAGTCARLSPAEREARIAKGLVPTLRFRVHDGNSVEFDDFVRGPQKFSTTDIGDFIIRRADGSTAFFFSNAIDDARMEVTHVLRGEDHLTNTPRQILLLQALGLRIPGYGHISMIVGDDGAPLSKRHGSRSVRELREMGFLPLAVVNYLARLGHYYEDATHMSFDELAARFELSKLGRSPARYDYGQLLYYQQEAVARCDDESLWQWMGSEVQQFVPAVQKTAFVAAVRPNVVLPPDAERWARILFVDPLELSEEARVSVEEAGAAFFEHALNALATHGTEFKAVANGIKESLGVKGKALFHPLRAALTGVIDGPEMGQILPLLSVERARARLQMCRDLCARH